MNIYTALLLPCVPEGAVIMKTVCCIILGKSFAWYTVCFHMQLTCSVRTNTSSGIKIVLEGCGKIEGST